MNNISDLADIEYSIIGTNIIIEDNVFIDSFVKIKSVGGIGDIKIGKNTHINSGTVIYSGNGVIIGEDVLIGPNCSIIPCNLEYILKDEKIINQRFKPSKNGIIIGNDVWIGSNTTILDGSVIKNGVVVGACSLVRDVLEEYKIYAGNPLNMIGERK